MECLWADAIHGGDQSAQHVVAPLKLAGALQGQQIARIGHHAQLAIAALGVAADLAERLSRQMKAAAALAHLAAGRQQGIGKGADLLFGLAQQVQCQTLGGARTDARQPLELVDQPGQRAREAAQVSAASGSNLRRKTTESRMGVGPAPCPLPRWDCLTL